MFRCIPLHHLLFLHTAATQHHLTGRGNTVLTNREMAASCMDRAGQGRDALCVQFFLLGMKRRERHGENMEERSMRLGHIKVVFEAI